MLGRFALFYLCGVIYDVAIVGAGAAGLMAAGQLRGKRVALVDGNSEVGVKLRTTGGGRGNVTNQRMGPEWFQGDRPFVAQVLERFGRDHLLQYLKERGLVPTVQESVVLGQYFCRSADELLQLLRRDIQGASLFMGEKITAIDRHTNGHFLLQTERRQLVAKRVVLAAGGPAYPQLGAGESGAQLAFALGHSAERFDPALVGLTTMPEQRWMTELSGLSADVEIAVGERTVAGRLLFAHRGITGPAVMNSSLWWRKGAISIDWLPGFRLEQLFKERKKQLLSKVLPLPKRLAIALLQQLGVDDLPLSAVNAADFEKLKGLHAYRFAPSGRWGWSRAEVARGGVSTTEVNPQTMESLLVPGLYLVGELLDVTGELGGYNLQWAFATGFLAGQALSSC